MEAGRSVELPGTFDQVDIDILVILIGDMLDRLMSHNDRIPLSPEALTRFHSRTPPNISVLEYLRRIVKYLNVERTCLLVMLHYIDRICARRPHFTLSSLTCHRFLITAVCVSSKALCDAFSTNTFYARVGGIPLAELNILERVFLELIDWRLTVPREILETYYINLVRTHSDGIYRLREPPSSGASSSGVEDYSDEEPQRTDQQRPVPVSPDKPKTVATALTTALSPSPRVEEVHSSPQAPQGPTLEQNMAFQALQRSGSPLGTSQAGTAAPLTTRAPSSRSSAPKRSGAGSESDVPDSPERPKGRRKLDDDPGP